MESINEKTKFYNSLNIGDRVDFYLECRDKWINAKVVSVGFPLRSTIKHGKRVTIVNDTLTVLINDKTYVSSRNVEFFAPFLTKSNQTCCVM